MSNLLFQNDTSHGIAVWEMNGTTVVANPHIVTAQSGSELAATGDFNGDGKADLLFINDTTHDVTMWEMNYIQVMTERQWSAPLMPLPSGNSRAPTISTGTSTPTCCFSTPTTNGVALWEMNGTQVMANPQIGTINAASGWHFEDTGDFN